MLINHTKLKYDPCRLYSSTAILCYYSLYWLGHVRFAEIWLYVDAYAEMLWEENIVRSRKSTAEVV